MAVMEITKDNFEAEVLNSDKPVLLDFWADWCVYCRPVAPTVEAIAEEYPNIKVCKVDVSTEQALALQFNILSIPALLVFKNGEKTQQVAGARSKEEILALIEA